MTPVPSIDQRSQSTALSAAQMRSSAACAPKTRQRRWSGQSGSIGSRAISLGFLSAAGSLKAQPNAITAMMGRTASRLSMNGVRPGHGYRSPRSVSVEHASRAGLIAGGQVPGTGAPVRGPVPHRWHGALDRSPRHGLWAAITAVKSASCWACRASIWLPA
jgi:hypothetical protein